MHLIDPRPQRQGTRGSVDGEVTDHLGGGGVDEDRPGFALAEAGIGIHHPRGVARLGCRRTADSVESLPAITVFAASIWSAGSRQRIVGGGDAELVGIDQLLERRTDRVGRPGERGDEDERTDEDPRVEVETAQKRA